MPIMIDRKAVLFRLDPAPEQAAQRAQIAGTWRFVHTLALERRRDWCRSGRTVTFANQCREVTPLQGEVAWLKVGTKAAITIPWRADGAVKPVEGHRSKRPDQAGISRRAA